MADSLCTGASAQITPFNFNSHAVRVIQRDGSPWFVAADVCAALGYLNTSKALGDHLDADERNSALVPTPNAPLGVPTNVISESGLYALVLRSRKPEARKFAKWVTSEVLPAIRKTGRYEAPAAQPALDYTRISPAQAQTLKELVQAVVASGAQGYGETWARLHNKFRVNSYLELAASQFEPACDYLRAKAPQAPALPAPTLRGRRWLISVDGEGREVVAPIPADAFVLTAHELAGALLAGEFSRPDLLAIANASAQRLYVQSCTDGAKGIGAQVRQLINRDLSQTDLREIVTSATLELWMRAMPEKS